MWRIAIAIIVLIGLYWLMMPVSEGYAPSPKFYADRTVGTTPVVTLHYTNWCGACRMMKPVWNELKQTPGYKFVEIDEDKTPTKWIKGYPTIYLYRDGNLHEYPGGADLAKLREFISNPVF